jgi:outer membrane protein
MRLRLGLVSALACGAPAGLAQEQPSSDGWSLTMGAGSLLAPAYEGDDETRLSLLPNIQVAYGDRFFASVQEGVGYKLVNDGDLVAGPIARIRFSRDEDGDQPFAVSGEDTRDLAGLGDVGASVELGGFLNYRAGSLEVSAEARQAVSGHEGFTAELGVRWTGRNSLFGPPVIWSVGPRLRFADERFTSAYFGVTPVQSSPSGLPVFETDGGLYAYGLGATAIIPLTTDGRWSAVAIAGYDQLNGDASASPLVRLRGSEHQGSLGVFLSYRFF